MQQRVAFAYAESNDILGNFLQVLKICMQTKWIVLYKKTHRNTNIQKYDGALFRRRKFPKITLDLA